MGRQPDGNYVIPDGTYGAPDQTVYSARYNGWVNDVAATFNAVLPVNKGGTGASTAPEALTALGAVAKAGDTMTGNLTIDKLAPLLDLKMGTVANGASIQSRFSTTTRWSMFFGDGTAESGSNAGSNFLLRSHNDAGAALVNAFSINRATGAVALAGDVTIVKSGPAFSLDTTVVAGGVNIAAKLNGLMRWRMFLMDGIAEGGGNTGSNFLLRSHNDAGTALVDAITINRATGAVALNSTVAASSSTVAALVATGGIATPGTVNSTAVVTTTASVQATGSLLPTGALALKIGYSGGGTQWGISMRPVLDNSNVLLVLNAANALVGSITQTAAATAFNTSSDGRLKEDLKSFDAGNIVDRTEVYDFAWKTTGERAYGIIAQQAKEVYPNAVTRREETDWWGIDYSKYVPVILQELKALRARIAELEVATGLRPETPDEKPA